MTKDYNKKEKKQERFNARTNRRSSQTTADCRVGVWLCAPFSKLLSAKLVSRPL